MNKSEIREKTQEILKKADDQSVFINNLQELLHLLVDEKSTENYKRLILDTGKFYGVPKPVLWVMSAEIGKFLQKNPNKAPLLLEALWEEGSYETRQIAGKSMEKFGPKHQEITLNFVYSAIPDINNWSLCDSLAMYAVEPLLLNDPEPVLKLSENCVKSDNKWTRRFGIVSLRGYRKLKITSRVFSILDICMDDPEKDVKKAVSWILRMITPNNNDEILSYLTKWANTQPNKDTKWIIKDGMKKLTKEEQKNLLNLL